MSEATPQDITQTDRTAAEPGGRKRARLVTHRQCAVTRQERAVFELLRFVAAPDDTICPDLAGKLPGRGVWLTADKKTVAAAVKSNAFAKSLKRKVTAAPDLPEIVEKLLDKRTTEALSLANKAGLLLTGFDKVTASIERGEVAALLHGNDAAAGGRQKLDTKYKAIQAAAAKTAVIVDCLPIDDLSLATGRPNVVHAALKDGGAAVRFIAEADRLTRYRTGSGFLDAVSAAGDRLDPATAPPRAAATDDEPEDEERAADTAS